MSGRLRKAVTPVNTQNLSPRGNPLAILTPPNFQAHPAGRNGRHVRACFKGGRALLAKGVAGRVRGLNLFLERIKPTALRVLRAPRTGGYCAASRPERGAPISIRLRGVTRRQAEGWRGPSRERNFPVRHRALCRAKKSRARRHGQSDREEVRPRPRQAQPRTGATIAVKG